MPDLLPSLAPILAIIAVGALLRRLPLAGPEGWIGLERISYYVFFPLLLFQTLARAQTGAAGLGSTAGAFLAGIAAVLALGIVLAVPFRGLLGLSGPAYSSVYQAITRWNAFVVLAIAEQLYGARGLEVVAIGIGVMVAPINVVNILVIARLCRNADGRPEPHFHRLVATNPLIIAVIVGLLANFVGLKLPAPAATTMDLLARISLPLGLLLVGAGLRLAFPARDAIAIFLATALKLLAMPLILGAAAWLFGLRGADLALVALCGAGPSAMNGYVVARQMGGDAPLFAAMVSLQTVVCFLTLPAVIWLALQISG